MRVPALIVTSDEDWPCLQPSMKIEEPAAFISALADHVAQAEAGQWPVRDPRAMVTSITGGTK